MHFAPKAAPQSGAFADHARGVFGGITTTAIDPLVPNGAVENNKRYRRRNCELVCEYLLTHPCVDCGESDMDVLDFDHVRGRKNGDVSILARSAIAWKRVAEEIAKCEIRCANCHRRRTQLQLGWNLWRLKVTDSRVRKPVGENATAVSKFLSASGDCSSVG